MTCWPVDPAFLRPARVAVLAWLAALACGLGAAGARGQDPPAAQGPENIKGLEGLGFSIAPKGGGKTRTGLFGVYGEGYKFVYVFDRSGSMGGSGRNSLKAVKRELIASLQNLDTVHQFQIIFYNEKPTLFNPTGVAGQLVFATDANKESVVRFLDTIQADGGTDHLQALRMAFALRPDVIFFLTDGDDPKLSPHEIQTVERWTGGIRLNTIQFGPGPKPAEESFLVKLAHQSGGDYVYVDTKKF